MHEKESMKTVNWKIYLKSSPELVFSFFTSESGREKFWAEQAPERNGVIYFTFPNGESYHSKILKVAENREFNIEYFNSHLKIILAPAEENATDLTLINRGISDADYLDIHAGWVSVLMNLKAVVDYNCDLRNHDKNRTWNQKYVDN